MEPVTLAALVFAAGIVGVVAFQVALAAGAPWGAYAMGGSVPGRFPAKMRVSAIVQAVILAFLGLVVCSAAGIAAPGLVEQLPWLPWLPVAVSGVGLLLNAISPSAGERRLWVPVTAVMLVTSLVVALGR
jgi:cytochrome bd-type quinol oxidase subunit 2